MTLSSVLLLFWCVACNHLTIFCIHLFIDCLSHENLVLEGNELVYFLITVYWEPHNSNNNRYLLMNLTVLNSRGSCRRWIFSAPWLEWMGVGGSKGKWRPRMQSLFWLPPAACRNLVESTVRSCHIAALGFCETVSFLITNSVPPLPVSAGSLSIATKDSNNQTFWKYV